jgi:hypothetical protein
MKRLFNTRILILTTFLLLAAIPVAATERPFALNGKGTAFFILDESGNVTGAKVIAAGTATHLGLWTTTGSVSYAPPDANGVIRSSGTATVTAANGDTLELVIEGSLDAASFIDHGTYQFVRGTGQFRRVSGGGNFVVSGNAPNGGFELTMVGKITFFLR